MSRWRCPFAWSVFALLVSLTLYSGLDRVAGEGFPVENLKFVPKGAQRLRSAAVHALSRGQADVAARFARASIAREPLNPGALAILGQAQLRLGEFDAAERSFLAAGSFGWRDAVTQAYLISYAEATGDVRVMAERADALLRTGHPFALIAPTLRKIEQMPDGKVAVATRLSQRPDWGGPYVAQVNDESDEGLNRRLETIRLAARNGFLIDCQRVDAAAASLLQGDRPEAAYLVWRQLGCGDSGPYNLDASAGDFADISLVPPRQPTSFGWTFRTNAETESRLDQLPTGRAERAAFISSSGSIPIVALTRALLLPPGRFRLTWREHNVPSLPRLRVSVEVICYNNGISVTDSFVSRDRENYGKASLSVPASRCGAQQLRFVAQPTSGQRLGVWIDKVSIEPVLRSELE